jgi:hypothetical protein
MYSSFSPKGKIILKSSYELDKYRYVFDFLIPLLGNRAKAKATYFILNRV